MFRSLGVALVTSVILAVSGSFIIGLFTEDPLIRHTVLTLIWLSVFLEPGRMANEILIGALNTAGDVKFPTMISHIIYVLIYRPNELSNWRLFRLWVSWSLDCVYFR